MDDRQEFVPFSLLLQEATQSVEQALALEDEGWLRMGGVTYTGLSESERILAIKNSRLYALKDPLGKQSIRLWTDYSFGEGMTFTAEDEGTQKVLDAFWGSKANRPILGVQGQHKSSNKLLIDGEVFFALFLGPNGEATLRWIDPLEITEIITNPEDTEDVRYYRREWVNPQSQPQAAIYRSFSNVKDVNTKSAAGNFVRSTEMALVYHVAYNTISQRGNPLLLPALDWIKQYRRFLASRVAIMLALTRFAWKNKVQGGAAAVAGVKATYNEETPEAGSMAVENMGSDLQPIKTDSGARNAYDDGRMLKLQVSAATGIPEQYFGDISTGNLATAKTVELPMLKQFQSYQQVWEGVYRDIDEMVLEHNRISPDKWYVDRNFPAIAPEDQTALAQAIEAIVRAFPEFADLPEVQQVALQSIGVDDVAKVLEGETQEALEVATMTLLKAVRTIRANIAEGAA